MVLTTLTGCKDYDDPIDGNEAKGVSLAFNVSTSRGATRMSEAVTQQTGQDYRGIQDQYLFPFGISGLIGTGEQPISDKIGALPIYKGTYYLDDKTAFIPNGTASFLCYARAVPQTKRGTETETLGEVESKFVNGSIMATGLTDAPNTSDISFAPEVIHNDVTIVENDKPSKIAAYLTAIANAIPAEKHDFFLQFINNGHPVACSSTNVEKLANWAKTEGGVDLTTITSTYDDDYPSSINLPDGAAVVKWNSSTSAFEPQPVTTTEANINSLNRFIYPAELWYYANSRIKTSTSSQKSNYDKTSWADVLANYDAGYGVMDYGVHSVAINDPLSYAVGCLQIGLVVGNNLTDANGTDVEFGTGKFPLTAVFVSGQYEQAFDFTPNSSINEYIIYDKEITGITMGDAKTSTPTEYTNTLVFQTQNDMSVRFALEFENDSGHNFQGANGIVFNGTKFYLVGAIDVPVSQTHDYQKRVFTKNYITKGTVSINSLKQTYTYLPDLLEPRLEIAIKLVPDWILSTPTNVPL